MNKKFFSNTLWLISFQCVKMLISFVVSILTARLLGPANYGIIGYVATFITLFSPFANLGLTSVIVKEYVQQKEESSAILKSCMAMCFISSAVCYILLNAIVFLLNINERIFLYCSLIQGLILFCNCFELVTCYFQANLQSKKTVIISFIGYLTTQALKVLFLFTSKGVIWFSFACVIDSITIAFLLFILTLRTPELRGGKVSKDIAKRCLKLSMPFILIGAISVIYASVDKLMIKHILGGTESVGFYNVAHSLATCWVFIVSAVITSFTPLIYESQLQDTKLHSTRIRQMYWAVFYIGAIISLIISALCPFAIPVIYGNVYNQAILPTVFLTWASVFAYMGVARGVQFVCDKKQKYLLCFSCLTVIVNIAFNSVLIPIMGVSGAALATLISEFFTCMICPLFFKETRKYSKDMAMSIAFQGVQFRQLVVLVKSKLKQGKNSNNAKPDMEPKTENELVNRNEENIQDSANYVDMVTHKIEEEDN